MNDLIPEKLKYARELRTVLGKHHKDNEVLVLSVAEMFISVMTAGADQFKRMQENGFKHLTDEPLLGRFEATGMKYGPEQYHKGLITAFDGCNCKNCKAVRREQKKKVDNKTPSRSNR
jgi:hypothetical protein